MVRWVPHFWRLSAFGDARPIVTSVRFFTNSFGMGTRIAPGEALHRASGLEPSEKRTVPRTTARPIRGSEPGQRLGSRYDFRWRRAFWAAPVRGDGADDGRDRSDVRRRTAARTSAFTPAASIFEPTGTSIPRE